MVSPLLLAILIQTNLSMKQSLRYFMSIFFQKDSDGKMGKGQNAGTIKKS
jgi:hypothetical protein